ncbi:cytochrome C biogenesis protein ResB [Corynebacterium poyangense]|uniref:Cytochrome C biogenesis protein ResB n=1 Tax=Corynebacterium poyangense TaxID=2684405 RepID=A0A7H0SLW3_9CORY|nr:cytochrome c biogenesis protein ResB [Corynebacterium poyangense]QNQ89538.1 cytochrome C biogenesis protein ResB [Corynebacterium poyangense]
MQLITIWLKRAWNWLTSMRTALALLFVAAVGAIPGALLPQRNLNEQRVEEYIANNGTIAEIYDKLRFFDVFSSPWFNAIGILLVISLVGCIIPRSWVHYKALRTPPVRAPKRLERMPHFQEGVVEKSEEDISAFIRRRLKRWHLAEYQPSEDRAGKHSFSAENGYIREFFNLVFHLALVAILLTASAGKLLTYEGQVIVIADEDGEGSTFCNTSTANYDSFRGGALFDGTGLAPFCVAVHDFTADYLPNGQAEMFSSNISYASGDQIYQDPSTWATHLLRVNHPLRIAGDRVYLQGHGFAPTFTITWPNGEKRTQTTQFRPDDPTFFLSSGAVRFDPPAGMYPNLAERRKNQIAIQGLFAPTAQWGGEKGQLLSSAFPQMKDPAVAIDIYRGDNGLDTGRGQELFSLDQSLIHTGQLQRIDRVNLTAGQEVTLDDGTVVRFDGAKEYANIQVSHDPTQVWVLISTVVGLAALVGSLLVKRRRIWVRCEPLAEGKVQVQVAGLARTDSAGWGEEFDDFARELLELPEETYDDEISLADAHTRGG